MSRDTRDDRPPLKASELPVGHVRMVPGQDRQVVCPDCGNWQVPRHGGLPKHPPRRAAAGVRWCPGSGRRVWFDLAAWQWWSRYQAACQEASSRSGRWAYRKVGAGHATGRRYAGPRGDQPPLLSDHDTYLVSQALTNTPDGCDVSGNARRKRLSGAASLVRRPGDQAEPATGIANQIA